MRRGGQQERILETPGTLKEVSMAAVKILRGQGCEGGEGSERAGLWFEWNQLQNDKLRGHKPQYW